MDAICKNLCEKNDCELIFCCEYGSRLFGYDTRESDRDVRGIYIRKDVDYYKYLAFTNYKVVDARDMLVEKVDDVDVELWDFRKVVSLYFTKFNQAPVAWMASDSVYYETEKSNVLKRFLSEKNKLPSKGVLSHYYGLSRSSWQEYRRTKNIKKYILAYINVLISEGLIERGTVPDLSSYKKELGEMRTDERAELEDLESRLDAVKASLKTMNNYRFAFDDDWKRMVDFVANPWTTTIFGKFRGYLSGIKKCFFSSLGILFRLQSNVII